jgi:hypothetical protein
MANLVDGLEIAVKSSPAARAERTPMTPTGGTRLLPRLHVGSAESQSKTLGSKISIESTVGIFFPGFG